MDSEIENKPQSQSSGSENDVFRLWEAAEKDNDLKDNQRRYLDIIRSAFEIEPVKIDRTEVLDKLIDRGFKIGTFRIDDKNEKYAIKKLRTMTGAGLGDCKKALAESNGNIKQSVCSNEVMPLV